jgi:hypothetical protein
MSSSPDDDLVTGAVPAQIAERRRRKAARQVIATFEPEDFATAEEQRTLLALWASPRVASTQCRPRRQRR